MTLLDSGFPRAAFRDSGEPIPAWGGTAPLTRRRFGLLIAAAAGAIGLPGGTIAGARARDATPTDDLGGYPELKIISTDAGLTLPAQISAGRYLVTIENRATLGESAPNFILLPEGQTTEELLSAPVDPLSGMPSWFYSATIVGAPIAPIGSTAQAIVDLAPGRYAVSGEPFQPSSTLEVAPGAGATPPEPATDATIVIGDGALTGVPARVTTGKLLWRVAAVGDVPHRFQLYSFPEPITLDQIIAAYTHLVEGTTPEAGLPDLSLVVQLGGLGAQSGGQIGWPVIDLAPGQYIAMCGIQEGEAGIPHGLQGEAAVFTVGDDPAA
jgi:hypothetical protein